MHCYSFISSFLYYAIIQSFFIYLYDGGLRSLSSTLLPRTTKGNASGSDGEDCSKPAAAKQQQQQQTSRRVELKRFCSMQMLRCISLLVLLSSKEGDILLLSVSLGDAKANKCRDKHHVSSSGIRC